jgi:hypothetical protein
MGSMMSIGMACMADMHATHVPDRGHQRRSFSAPESVNEASTSPQRPQR